MALNELDGLKHILPMVDRGDFEQIIVADGNSGDGTEAWCLANGYEVYLQQEPGLRAAYKEVWPNIRGEYVVTFSPDGNCDPSKIPLILDEIRNNRPDLVIGSRYLPGVSSDDDDFVTRFGNWLFNAIARKFFGGKVTDVMVIYRGFRKNLVDELGLFEDKPYQFFEKVLRTKISIEPLMSVRAIHRKYLITEIPAGEPPRIFGERKLQIVRWGLAYMGQFIVEKLKR